MTPDAPGSIRRREWILAGGWALFILVATSVPLPGGSLLDRPILLFGFLEADKVAHATMYGVLGWLTVGALDATVRVPPTRRLLGGLAAAAAFAAFDEWHQSWIPSRSPELVDWAADAAGLAVGAAARRVHDRVRAGPNGPAGTGAGEDQQEERGPQGE